MRVGSLFSGVGGFDMGLEAAGMEIVWQVEYDEQAQSVLRHHWPNVDLHKDVRDVVGIPLDKPASHGDAEQSRHRADTQGGHGARHLIDSGRGLVTREGGRSVGPNQLAPVDLICGGFPCQDVSVAGKRGGLAAERSGLFYEFMRIVDELAPRWVLIENVPGLLSSNGGRDMGAVVGTLGDLGYGWTYRVLDTQYFGPPQRRRRVFIVGCAGGYCPPEVLLEPESVPWHPAPRREAGKGAAGGVEGGPGGAGGVAPTLTVGGRDRGAGDSYDNTPVVAHTLRGEGFDASEDGTGRGTPLVVSSGQTNAEITRDFAPTLNLNRDGAPIVLPFDTTQITSKANYSHPRPGDPCHPLAAGAHAPAVAFYSNLGTHGGGVGDDVSPTIRIGSGLGIPSPPAVASVGTVPRRLTPVECERLQGWPDDWTRYGRTLDGEMVELKDSPRYKMCGNGVSAPVAEWIGRKIMEAA